jgi:hypothetical protein
MQFNSNNSKQEGKAMGAYRKRRKRQGRSTQARGGICGRNPFQQKTRETTEEDSREATSSTLITSVIQIKIKLLHGVMEVQGTIMALLDNCLITLQEREKSTRLLSQDKSEEAF